MNTRRSRLRLTRFRADMPCKNLHVRMPQDDTFYAIFQLKDHPPHEFWADGRHERTVHSPRGCLHIANLASAPSARLDEPFDSLNIELPRAALDDLAEDVGAPRIAHLGVPDPWQTPDEHLALLEPFILSALSEPETASPLFTDQVLLTAAIHIGERYGGLRRQRIRPGGLAPWQERRAREMIASDAGSHLSLSAVAAECGLSLSHFCKAFKASTGATPHGWLQQCRLDRARTLMERPAHSLAEVALLCGFADQSHFNRSFRRHTGLTPGQWRRQRL